MAEEVNYLIWPEHPATGQFHDGVLSVGFQDCPRAGGGYIITLEAAGMLNSGLPMSAPEKDKLRARLTTMLIDERRYGVTYPVVTRGFIERAISERLLQVHERADRLLRFIASQAAIVGASVTLSNSTQEVYAWSESLDWIEINYFLEYLREREWIKGDRYMGGGFVGTVTVDGYGRIAEQVANIDSSQAFVAMWFEDSMNEPFETGIKSAVEEAGYNPLRIDRKDHVNKIDDEIIAELRRSRFVVADFTHGDSGARGGVYYEAGFAHGLNLPVIFTCRKDAVESLHFDTNHYSHIVWSTPAELREKLKTRILAVIGQGPGVSKAP